jgi:hypothetical protein
MGIISKNRERVSRLAWILREPMKKNREGRRRKAINEGGRV